MSKIEIIISHSHSDLDSLASMLLASKLYPNAKMVFVGDLNENVKEVVSLYGNYLNIYKSRDINEEKVEKIIIVDTSNEKRIGKFAKCLENTKIKVILYDHHEDKKNKNFNWEYHMTEYGATTTFLLEKIIEKNIEISDYEATIIMMGIYEDTGSLSYTNTTSNDIKAAAYLLEKGANIRLVAQFISKSMKKDQIDLFIELLQSGETLDFSAEKIFVAKHYSKEYIGDLDMITNKIKDIEGVKGVFILVGDFEHSYIVGRSSSPDIKINEILSFFNGGGHSNAGAASLKNKDFIETYSELKEEIYKKIGHGKIAQDIMTSPVKTVHEDIKIKDVYKIMLQFSYNGIPVVEKHKVVGIITRRDVDRALNHGFSNANVSVYMNKNIISANKNTSIDKLKKLILDNEIGRILILDLNKTLIGIVSRSDILRSIYEHKKNFTSKEYIFQENIKEKLLNLFTEDILNLFNEIKIISKKRNEKVYLVGGIVRDIILGIKNLDIDIVVEGDGINFAKDLFKKINGKNLTKHYKFKTAVLELDSNLKIDIASSRIEYYEYPTSLPTVEFGSLKQDLFRRDFTINSMALEIDDFNFGRLIDFYEGYKDIFDKKIRVLHSFSFIEDPTRIIRGIRFSNRLNFEIEENTKQYLNSAIENGFLNKLSWKRVLTEFIIICKEKDVKTAISKLFEYGVIAAIHPLIKYTKKIQKHIDYIKKYEEIIFFMKIETWLVYFLILLEDLESKELNFVFQKFAFSQKFIEKYNYGKVKRDSIINRINVAKENSELYYSLNKIPKEFLIILLISSNNEIQNKIIFFIKELSKEKPLITGKDLISLNYKPGEEFSEILEKLFRIQLDNGLKDKESLLRYIDN